MTNPAAAELRRWSDEVARDPGAPAFLPLARALRRQGRRDAALRLCLRGLEHNPGHLEAHALLAVLYLEAGDRDRACDEWAAILRHDAGHFEANRGLGFHWIERGELARARPHLERALDRRPEDGPVREALTVLAARGRGGERGSGGVGDTAIAPSPTRPLSHSAGRAPAGGPASGPPGAEVHPHVRDPARVFEPLLAEPPFLGGLVIDRQGLILAGTCRPDSDIEELGAVLGAAIDESARTAEYLALGHWRGALLEAERAVVHMTPLPGDLAVLLAVRSDVPAGYVLRLSARASQMARAFLGVEP
ncbi:MAG TPA: tetratricopeptide repeat protein [Longimicrobiales bacterium]|nr:tetratricopeptide repeat protein [Longimicrobiales bacterium]